MEVTENLTFNTCSKLDLEQVTKLAHRIWPSTFKDILSEDQLNFMLNWMYDLKQLEMQYNNGHLFFLAKENEECIGFMGLEPHFPEEGILRIHKFYLLQEYQGKSIGKWMLNQAEKWAVDNKMHALHLNVNRYNSAVEFYKKTGFEIILTEDIDIGQGYYMNDYVMLKNGLLRN